MNFSPSTEDSRLPKERQLAMKSSVINMAYLEDLWSSPILHEVSAYSHHCAVGCSTVEYVGILLGPLYFLGG